MVRPSEELLAELAAAQVAGRLVATRLVVGRQVVVGLEVGRREAGCQLVD